MSQINRTHSDSKIVSPPVYDPGTHYKAVARDVYFQKLLHYRHHIKQLCDEYMSARLQALNIDLFMLTPSVSSPMGPGSDSEAIPIQFGQLTSYLTDSSQFGFEPIVMNGIPKVYCYLPSMRGEDPDDRHLNQFFHCEVELRGDLARIMEVGEEFVKHMANGILEASAVYDQLNQTGAAGRQALTAAAQSTAYRQITFDEACDLLTANGAGHHISTSAEGRDISAAGEQRLLQLLKATTPVWLTHFDRVRVPFYQKPDPADTSKVLNADLLFPAITSSGFGGEILGCGQRQDNPAEMYASLKQQAVAAEPYEWYIDLRKDPAYEITAGFGLGIERFIAWSLGLSSIRDAIVYPRLKNIRTLP